MPDYQQLESHADLGGVEMFPDQTEDLRQDALSGHEKGGQCANTNRLETNTPTQLKQEK